MFTHHAFTVHTLGLGTRLQTSQAHLDHAFPSVPLECSKGVNKTFEILFFSCRDSVKSFSELWGVPQSPRIGDCLSRLHFHHQPNEQ